MAERDELLTSIATRIADYRERDVTKPDSVHVDRWINQFDCGVQLPILREMDHVLGRTYFTRQFVLGFLGRLLTNEKLAGKEPCKFWKSVKFLDIQKGGASQADMLALFDEILRKECGVVSADCGKPSDTFIYLDDAVFTGNRVLRDLEAWLKGAPDKAKLHIIAIALHRYGRWSADKKLSAAARREGKNLDVTWWRAVEVEDRKTYTDSSDVLRPCMIPDVAEVKAYVAAMTYKPHLRTAGSVGALGILFKR
jgi:hypothetical protein